MLEILRDPVWQFMGVATALLICFFSFVLARMEKRKELSYKVISVASVLRVAAEVQGKLTIRYGESSVRDLYLVVVKVINAGYVPIRSTDYDSPVTLSFGVGAQVFEVEVAQTDPASLRALAKASIDGNSVVLTPVLLNPEDSVTLDLLVSQYEKLKIEARIAGVRNIRESVDGLPHYSLVEWTAIFGTAMFVILIVLALLIIGGDLFITMIGYSIDRTGSQFHRMIVGPLLADASYREGFVWGLIVSLVIGWTSRRILFLRSELLRFSKVTRKAAAHWRPAPRNT